jgi:hypothetical protein
MCCGVCGISVVVRFVFVFMSALDFGAGVDAGLAGTGAGGQTGFGAAFSTRTLLPPKVPSLTLILLFLSAAKSLLGSLSLETPCSTRAFEAIFCGCSRERAGASSVFRRPLTAWPQYESATRAYN